MFIGARKSRIPVAVYADKKSDGLKAPVRKYECVVFNVTIGNKSEVSKWISDNDVNVMDASRLSKDDAAPYLFKVCRSTDYIRNYLSINNCDILCLQKTWHLDDNIQYFNKIHTDYLFAAISGVNSKDRILPGCPKRGVAILYKKIICNKAKQMNLWNNY